MRGAQVKAAVGADPNGTLVRPDGDFFATSPIATRALLSVETFSGVVWEPACGDGAIARVLEDDPNVNHVFGSDLYDRGYGANGINFLTAAPRRCDHIVTNPPFNLIEKFVWRALEINPPGKIAIFARLAFLEGQRRHRTLWSKRPPARVYVFSKRVPLARNGGAEQTGLIAFAWFIWETQWQVGRGETQLSWL